MAADQRVIDDIAILEAALDRATERKRTASPRGTPARDTGRYDIAGPPPPLDGSQATAKERERLYATQLKSWVDMQVDARLKLVLRDVDSELLASRQESRAALELARLSQEDLGKIEQLVLSADDQTRREMAEVQQETLSTVSDLIRTVDELKGSFSAVEDMRRLHLEHEKAFQEIRRLQVEHSREVEKLAMWRAELVDDLGTEIREKFTGQLDSLRSEVATAARQVDLEELQSLFEKANRRLGDDLLAHSQRLISELRSETTAAFKSESVQVTALDEQVWRTDQRLGQRIDQVAQQCRECAMSIDDCVRSHNDTQRSHQDSMARIKGLALSHRDTIRSRSPDQYNFVDRNLSERPLRSPLYTESARNSEGPATRTLEQLIEAGEARSPPSQKFETFGEEDRLPVSRPLSLRVGGNKTRSLSAARGGTPLSRGEAGGLARAVAAAGDAFAEIGAGR